MTETQNVQNGFSRNVKLIYSKNAHSDNHGMDAEGMAFIFESPSPGQGYVIKKGEVEEANRTKREIFEVCPVEQVELSAESCDKLIRRWVRSSVAATFLTLAQAEACAKDPKNYTREYTYQVYATYNTGGGGYAHTLLLGEGPTPQAAKEVAQATWTAMWREYDDVMKNSHRYKTDDEFYDAQGYMAGAHGLTSDANIFLIRDDQLCQDWFYRHSESVSFD
jgi:hypothetical protein